MCRQLGYSPYGKLYLISLIELIHYYYFILGAIAKTSFYTETILPHTMFNMNCTGDEATLFDCVYSEVVSVGSNCYSYEDAGVTCQGYRHNLLSTIFHFL